MYRVFLFVLALLMVSQFLLIGESGVSILSEGSAAFGSKGSFWERHGLLFLFFAAIFPRLTLLFSSVASGGILWWTGWVFLPRLLIALLATAAYIHTNPILVAVSWLIAIFGEVSEKILTEKQIKTNVYVSKMTRRKAQRPSGDNIIEGEILS